MVSHCWFLHKKVTFLNNKVQNYIKIFLTTFLPKNIFLTSLNIQSHVPRIFLQGSLTLLFLCRFFLFKCYMLFDHILSSFRALCVQEWKHQSSISGGQVRQYFYYYFFIFLFFSFSISFLILSLLFFSFFLFSILFSILFNLYLHRSFFSFYFFLSSFKFRIPFFFHFHF